MRSAFIDKLIKRMDRLEPGEVQGIVMELLREKKLLSEDQIAKVLDPAAMTDQGRPA